MFYDTSANNYLFNILYNELQMRFDECRTPE